MADNNADILVVSNDDPNTSNYENSYICYRNQSGDQGESKSDNFLAQNLLNLTAFNHISYLGSTAIECPKEQANILKCISLFNKEQHTLINSNDDNHPTLKNDIHSSLKVSIFIPDSCDNFVILYEEGSSNQIARFRVSRILFCARGEENSPEYNCFAFTYSHGDTSQNAIYRCHVFKCEESSAIGTNDILIAFAKAFRKPEQTAVNKPAENNGLVTENVIQILGVSLEIKEEPAKGNFSTCPFDNNFFKFRDKMDKRFNITVQSIYLGKDKNLPDQYGGDDDDAKGLVVERCFGIHITPGRDFNQNKLHLLDIISMSHPDNNPYVYQISVLWDPKDYNMDEFINCTSAKETLLNFTLGLDLIFVGLQEPVRLLLEVQARLYPENERFWYLNKKNLFEKYYLKIEKVPVITSTKILNEYHLAAIYSQSQLNQRSTHKQRPSSLASLTTWRNYSLSSTPSLLLPKIKKSLSNTDENDSENDEPLLSGTGEVKKACESDELEEWKELLKEWRVNPEKRPKEILSMCKKGIPDELRGEIWQLLTLIHQNRFQFEEYQELSLKESIYESVIQRDIHRTFPAHDYFKKAGSVGQDSLYRLSKAYAVFDQEIGYCQGLSFLAASLLLHMPEEEAFNVLVKIMHDYNLRSLFKQGFEELKLKFYQLDRLIEQNLPLLFSHFQNIGLEVHMFASQWFLTLFTAKFPLNIVFNILDVFLCLGIITIFHISLALLKMSESELLSLDFEETLKYFRINLPKKFRNEELSIKLMDLALNIKISPKSLKKYEKYYQQLKEQEELEKNPLEILKKENQQMIDTNMRLERENDLLAHELVSSKVRLRNDLDATEDTAENLSIELEQTMKALREVEDENKRLIQETQQVKEMCRREIQRYEIENKENESLIYDYKQICHDLSQRIEEMDTFHKSFMTSIEGKDLNCPKCKDLAQLLDKFSKEKLIHDIKSEKNALTNGFTMTDNDIN